MSQVRISPMRIYHGKSWGFILICLQATQKAQPAISCCVPGCTTPFKNSDRFASDRKVFVREEEGFMFGMRVKVNAKPQFAIWRLLRDVQWSQVQGQFEEQAKVRGKTGCWGQYLDHISLNLVVYSNVLLS